MRPDISAQTVLQITSRFSRALAQTPSLEKRAELTSFVVLSLGEHGYPAFIKILLILSESKDIQAKARINEVLVYLLDTNSLPSGQLSAWGASLFWGAQDKVGSGQSFTVRQLSSSSTPIRKYGPIEYLTVWYSQKTHRPYLTDEIFRNALETLFNLFTDTAITQKYSAYLDTELNTAAMGAYSNITRQRLSNLAIGWRKGLTSKELVDIAVE